MCTVIEPAKSRILFPVNDLDRLVTKHSTELDNRLFGTRTIGFIGFAENKYIDYKDIDR